jgi:hypothetical protein
MTNSLANKRLLLAGATRRQQKRGRWAGGPPMTGPEVSTSEVVQVER